MNNFAAVNLSPFGHGRNTKGAMTQLLSPRKSALVVPPNRADRDIATPLTPDLLAVAAIVGRARKHSPEPKPMRVFQDLHEEEA